MKPKRTVFQDERIAVEIVNAGDSLTLSLTDKSGGRRWGPAPLLELDVYDKMQKRLDVLPRFAVDRLERVAGGVHVTVRDAFRGVRAGLWVRIVGGELSLFLQPMEVYEDKEALYRLFGINLLPGLIRTGRSGTVYIPVTTGMSFSPADKPKLADRFLVYGEQERWELLPHLPFCAAADAGGGLMALAVQCASDTECRVAADGEGNGEVGFAFFFRRLWPDPVDFENREIRFIPIPKKERAEIFIADRIRRHVMDDLGKPTLAEREKESPEVAYLLGAYIMKMFYAIENEGICMYGRPKDDPVSFLRVMTFAEAKANLGRLRDAGVDRILTQSVGWNPRGHDGMYPTRLPPDERLGGEAGFRDLIASGNAMGFNMSVHDNYIDSYKVSPDWSAETTIVDVYGEPLVAGLWGGGINYRQWPLALPYERLEGQMRALQALGIRGMFYSDGMGNPLECNHHPRWRGPRSGHAKGICRILETARKVFGACGTENGFLYCAVPSDCIVSFGWGWDFRKTHPEWPVSTFCDRQLPIWQLALHGLIVIEGHGLKWPAVMHKVAFGLHPRTEWSAHPGIHPVLDDAMIGALKADYDLVLKRFGYLQKLRMTDWRTDGKTVATRFEDGTEVIADYARERLTVGGKNVPRPAALLPK